MSFSLQLQESEQLSVSLHQQLGETQQQVKELQEKLVDSESSRAMEEEISKELQEQVRGHASPFPTAIVNQVLFSGFNQRVSSRQVDLLTEELSGARGQKERSSAAQEELQSELMAERDQLKAELHQNVQMVGKCI